jgi:DNA-binding NtrC family response regulator
MIRCATTEPCRAGAGRQPRGSVLVVDNEPTMAGALAKLLRVDGFAVEILADVAAAAARIARGPAASALVMDVSPARADEVDAVARLHALHPSLTLVLVTAYPQIGARLGSPDVTCRVLTKPVDYPSLLGLLEVGL